jgi:hypothetical protein
MIALVALSAMAAAPVPLAPLLESIRLSVPDARQISDVQVCPPRKVSKDGRKFITDVALARPHVTRQYYTASWRDGRIVKLTLYPATAADLEPGGDIWKQIGIRALQRQMEPCRWIPAVELAAAWAQLDAR